MAVQCLLAVSCPGTRLSLRDNADIKALMSILDANGIEYRVVDTVAGWGCLNQDWLEFSATVETSWDWCYPTFIAQSEWQSRWYPLLADGRLLMQVHYKDGENLVAHH